ncbi:unnamed protein product [Anisakis simplex]|uniref:P-type domain-containing protein n=1 Tax=Anisakis simplex TaxID=6269 RepID=A0A0M3J9P0_ANISI|nr:unnamed protein product [Anisakis simplex]
MTEKECENGGQVLNLQCTSAWQCNSGYLGADGEVDCINGYCCTVPEKATPVPSRRFGRSHLFFCLIHTDLY